VDSNEELLYHYSDCTLTFMTNYASA